jgi:hypothetical protein
MRKYLFPRIAIIPPLLLLASWRRYHGPEIKADRGLMKFSGFKVESEAAAVRMFLGFFRFGVLAFEVGERHVQ